MSLTPKISSPESHRPRTLLIVEDEHLMRRLLEKFFSRHGYRALAASDGKQAVEMYNCYKLEIDAVLLDIRLPKRTGEEVFRRMKEANPAVKVVVTSGYLEANTKAKMGFAGVEHFVKKPYALAELLEIFRELIGNG